MKKNIFILFILLLGGCKASFPPVWWYERAEVEGLVDSCLHQPETQIGYVFYVNGRMYRGAKRFGYHLEFAPGSRHMISYNPANPEENRIELTKPIIGEDEDFSTALGYVGRGWPGIRDSGVEDKPDYVRLYFEFHVSGKKYTVKNWIPNEKGYTKEDIEEKWFKVTYWTENPQRAYILLDEPAKNQ